MSVDYKWANAVMDQLKGCQAEIARLRLTDAEREAVIWAAHAAKYWAMYSENHAERELFAKRGEALRWLAEKHKCD